MSKEEVSGDVSVFETEPGGSSAPSVVGLVACPYCSSLFRSYHARTKHVRLDHRDKYNPRVPRDPALVGITQQKALLRQRDRELRLQQKAMRAERKEIEAQLKSIDIAEAHYKSFLEKQASPLTGPVSDRTAPNTDATRNKAEDGRR